MFIKFNKTYLFAFLLFFVLAGSVFASSSSFSTQAQKFIHDTCSKKNLGGQTETICYLFYKSQEHDATIAQISATISPMPSQIASLQASVSAITTPTAMSGKSIHVIDANNQDIGIYMGDNANKIMYVFVPALNRRIIIDSGKIPYDQLYYASNDCTGTPYMFRSELNFDGLNVYSAGPAGYYEMKSPVIPTSLTYNSRYYNSGPNQFTCGIQTYTSSNENYEAVKVTLPFTEPLAQPLQLKYQ